jgi:hypothetical protein
MNTTTQQHGDATQTRHDLSDQNVNMETLYRNEAERRFQAWVDSVRWQFAKTYAKKAPHEYTVTDWRPDLEAKFKECVLFIRKHGQIDLYHGHPFTVYYMNGWKYWTMGDLLEETTLINRTCAEWCVRFKLTWNPPSSFKPMLPTQCESCRKILLAYDAICQTPPAKISPVINEKE